jgi:hypothetical protein
VAAAVVVAGRAEVLAPLEAYEKRLETRRKIIRIETSSSMNVWGDKLGDIM